MFIFEVVTSFVLFSSWANIHILVLSTAPRKKQSNKENLVIHIWNIK